MKKQFLATQRVDSVEDWYYNTIMMKSVIVHFVKGNLPLRIKSLDAATDSYLIGADQERRQIEHSIDNLLMNDKYLNHPNLEMVIVNLVPSRDIAEKIASLYNAKYVKETQEYR